MIDELSLEDWNKLWDAMFRSRGHEILLDGFIIPPAEVRIKVVDFLRKVRGDIVTDLKKLADQHPEQRAWTRTLALRYEKGDDKEK